MAEDWLAARFQDHRGRLRSVAYRMLGSVSEADDAVQETWLRLSRTDAQDHVRHVGGDCDEEPRRRERAGGESELGAAELDDGRRGFAGRFRSAG